MHDSSINVLQKNPWNEREFITAGKDGQMFLYEFVTNNGDEFINDS